MALNRVWIFCHHGPASEFVERVGAALTRAGLEVCLLEGGGRGGAGLLLFEDVTPEVCELIRELSRGGQERVLAVASSSNKLDAGACWLLLAAGASDVCAWDQSEDSVAAIAARIARWEQMDDLVRSPVVQGRLVGSSPVWVAVLRQIVEAARFSESAVLITGESGTGKELAARLIHDLDPSSEKGELVLVDCTTIVPTLSGSEFFGHEKGAFTGAIASRDGAFALADGGTLFLDEVGDLPLPLQAELLRVIQEGMYKRVGSNTWRRAKFRLLCATNRDLLSEEAQGRFRRDLYYRLATWTIRLPSLAERRDDIPLLVEHFLRGYARDGQSPGVDRVVAGFLYTRPYPGNVRELRQLVLRIGSRHQGPGPITAGDVPAEERPYGPWVSSDWQDAGFEQCIRTALARGATLHEIQRGASEAAIRIAVSDSRGNLHRASRQLGITQRALQLRRAARRRSLGPLRGTARERETPQP